jgi:formylglycine-generating enzyme required for sulfatase activity
VTWLARITGQPYRLLSEAEWEYAARAGSTAAWSFGNDEREICKYANLADRSLKKALPTATTIDFCDDGHDRPAPADSYWANAFGLHDMHGNVFEWIEDCYVDNYEGAPGDGAVRRIDDCKLRVARGGSWYNFPLDLRAAYRSKDSPDLRYDGLGFRVGRSLFSPRTQ